MPSREAEVLSVDEAQVVLRPADGRCEGCEVGCGGRCNLFDPGPRGQLTLPRPPGVQLEPGGRVRLSVDDDRLRNAAFATYGLGLAGLLGGALAGWLLARAAGWPPDPVVLAGVVLGTLGMLRRSRRHRLRPRLEPVASPAPGPHVEPLKPV